MRKRSRLSDGFSVIELLVVVSILTMLTGLLLPALSGARAVAQTAVCASHLRQLGIATSLYLGEFDDEFWRYYWTVPGGRQWWFGFEAGGPNTGRHRPLDKARSALAPFLNTLDDAFNCPTFPYDDPGFFPKFERHSASYGFNVSLGPSATTRPPRHGRNFDGRAAEVFVFADGIHFDHNPVFNEGHYIAYTANIMLKSGYAHFRHAAQAQMVMLDGHVDSQTLRGMPFAKIANIGGGQVGNLADRGGDHAIYGF